MHGHDIRLVECLRAVWTFAHAVLDTCIDTSVAEEVAARLERGVFEVDIADVAKGKSLR